MKQLMCEMCGSSDLLKTDGVFVCQACGLKYSVEEIRKMMIEGPVDVSGSVVKVDTSEKLRKLLLLADRARQEDNAEEAKKYYELARQEDPDSWSANFYSAYYTLMESPVGKLSEAITNFTSRIRTSMDIVLSGSPAGEAVPQLNDMLTSIGKVFAFISVHLNQRHQELLNETMSAMLDKVISHTTFGSTGNAYLKHQQDTRDRQSAQRWDSERQTLFSVSNSICRSTMEILATLVEKQLDREVTAFGVVAVSCDSVYGTDVKRLVYMPDPMAFATCMMDFYDAVKPYSFPLSDNLSLLQAQCKSIAKANAGKEPARQCEAVLNMIQKRERETRQREREAYWAAHPEEQEALRKEREQLLAEREGTAARIRELTQERDSVPAKAEMAEVDRQILRLARELDSLGIFRMKEKRRLQEQIDETRSVLHGLQRKKEQQMQAVTDRIDDVKRRQHAIDASIEEIDRKLRR